LFGLSLCRTGVRADGFCRGGAGHARQCHGRAHRKPDDGDRRIARHPVRRRRFRIDRGVRHAALDAGLQAERPWRRKGALVAGINKWKLMSLAALAAVVLVLPQVVKSSFAIDIFIRILLFSFIGVAWNLMGGYAKQLSLGHAAYFGLGAYTSTIMQVDFGISPWIGMVAGGIVAMLASLPIGWLCFRLRGHYFTIATIGEDEDAAEAIGVNAPRIKRDIYMISAFLTALAGTFYVQYIYFIDPATAFNFNISIEAALVSIVGGIGTLWGPVIGTVLLETTSALLQSWLGGSTGGVQLTVYALILMTVILWP